MSTTDLDPLVAPRYRVAAREALPTARAAWHLQLGRDPLVASMPPAHTARARCWLDGDASAGSVIAVFDSRGSSQRDARLVNVG
jgi:hypothetical protein